MLDRKLPVHLSLPSQMRSHGLKIYLCILDVHYNLRAREQAVDLLQ